VGLMAFGSLLALAAVRSTGSNLLGGQSLAVQGPDRDRRVRSFDRLTPRRLIVPIRRQSQGTARPIRSRSSVRRQPASAVLGPGYRTAICMTYLRTLSAFRERPVDGVHEVRIREMHIAACGRDVGMLQRRPVIAGEIKLIGKESNRLEDRFTGLLTIDELDERLTVYHDEDGWRRFTLPKLKAIGSRKVAEAVGMSERRARDVLKGRAMPHPKHRAEMERLAPESAVSPVKS